jgi:Sec7-like guanine-nucleotide exchange factor
MKLFIHHLFSNVFLAKGLEFLQQKGILDGSKESTAKLLFEEKRLDPDQKDKLLAKFVHKCTPNAMLINYLVFTRDRGALLPYYLSLFNFKGMFIVDAIR